MIYLIDDNQSNQRTNTLGVHYIEDGIFANILTSIEKLEKGCDLSFLNDASCILLHSTTEDVVSGQFISGSLFNTTKIIKEISDNGDKIPLVLFSEQMSEVANIVHDKFIRSIKKSVFYSHLYDFLAHHQATGEIEFKILAHSENFVSFEVSKLIQSLSEELLLKTQSDFVKVTEIKLKTFKELVVISDIGVSFDELITSLEDHPITVEKFLQNLSLINLSFAKYGKNIYGWL